jgi:xanthine dehydrogenase/oxidase
MIWNNVISQAYQNRVELSSQALYRTPGLSDSLDQQFYGFTYSACCSEVEIDVLTGESNVLRTDMLYDIGQSLNPAIDIGQIEGAFVMGLGYVLSEKLVWEPAGTLNPTGKLNTPNTWTYKPPCAASIPIDFRVDLFPREDAPRVPENPNDLMSSKGVGEPPLVLANTVFFAVKHAVLAARMEVGNLDWFQMEAPATVEEIRRLCNVDIPDLTFKS